MRVQALARLTKAPALQTRDLKVQRGDGGLGELEFLLQAIEQFARDQVCIGTGAAALGIKAWLGGGAVPCFEHVAIMASRASEVEDFPLWTGPFQTGPIRPADCCTP